jgi:hypothetical protein
LWKGWTRIYRLFVAVSRSRPRSGNGKDVPPGIKRSLAIAALLVLSCESCTTVDPGPNFSPANVSFDPDYFFCHVEPDFIFAKRCGPGDPARGETNTCHFTPSAVTGMMLIDHPPVDCGGGDHPLNRSQLGTGGAAQGNLEAVSFEMNKDDYTTAPLFVRPSGSGNALYHPRQIFDPSDMQVRLLLSTWASK